MADRAINITRVVMSGDRDDRSLFAIVNVKLLRVEERLPIWRVAANVLNRQWQTSDKRRSSSLGVGRGANKYPP